ncbi:PadR family transcriptional regulator [candidate division KSB1 bacterium]
MSELTKFEEQILLSVWKLRDEAYGLTIYRHIQKITGKKLSVGGIYFPLERMVQKGYLNAYKGDPTPIRGGQSKRFYTLTKEGQAALLKARREHEAFWSGLPDTGLSAEKP